MPVFALIAATALVAGVSNLQGPENPQIALAVASGSGSTVGTIVVDVTLSFDGNGALLLDLGEMLGNGTQLNPTALRLKLKPPAGAPIPLEFAGRQPGVAGRVDDYVVAMRSGGSYRLRLKLVEFWPVGVGKPLEALPPGKCRLSATYTGKPAQHVNADMEGLSTWRFWQGVVTSNEIDLSLPAGQVTSTTTAK